ncbi:endo-beta-1,6-galactanase [Mollisia scopiformis]|uniref:Endo-beta-1,6-galactanase n=1 Tax=Mollisia scopiformis TaxID=149040 RepID=A0A132BCF0_MOLSC|nr:endo-beta-1,6-galactanase [Mollisia scopiformis]KUJ09534.1 endo-beta-1,6-galactanase [Mollisia scopiformis]
MHRLVERADSTTTISPATTYGKWEGWGVSLAWWAAAFGDQDDLADIFFSTDWTTFNGVSIPGLGFNVVRYNAGACSWNTAPDGSTMVVSPDMISTRQMDGYWCPRTDLSTASSWDWTVDANQRAMMTKAQSRGVNYFELFSNSPMWWMTTNHNPSGNDDGSNNNLQAWNYDQHAIYLASIALKAKSSWGVTFTSVEPLNEPYDSWTGDTGTQEGCHFDRDTQNEVVIYLRNELNSRGLSSILVSASDENTYDQATATWNSFNSTGQASVGRVNTHGYQYGGGDRVALYDAVTASGLSVWNSEYGEDDATGEQLVSNLILDLIWLHNTAWVYWQALDGGGWGLIDADVETGTIGDVSQKYYVLALFTRHIREGMYILQGGSDYTVAAYDSSAEKLIIVAVNWGSAQYINFDLSEFSQGGVDGALVKRWSTQIGSGDQYANFTDTYLSGTKFWSYFDEDTVMTFEVDNVVI